MSRISAEHLIRRAVVYVRQSTADQVQHNLESQRRQYALADRARELGWSDVVVIDDDLGRSGSGVHRPGFERLLAHLCQGDVGAVFCIEASRLARNAGIGTRCLSSADWSVASQYIHAASNAPWRAKKNSACQTVNPPTTRCSRSLRSPTRSSARRKHTAPRSVRDPLPRPRGDRCQALGCGEYADIRPKRPANLPLGGGTAAAHGEYGVAYTVGGEPCLLNRPRRSPQPISSAMHSSTYVSLRYAR